MTVLREKPSGSPVFTFEGRRKKEEGRKNFPNQLAITN